MGRDVKSVPQQVPGSTGQLNVFALPSQTTVLVLLIIGVVYGSLLAIWASGSPIPLGPLLIGLFLLSLRAWIAWPERVQRVYAPVPAGTQLPHLHACIGELAQRLSLKRVPTLMIAVDADIAVYGGWRRWYILVDQAQAVRMEEALGDGLTRPYVEAVLLHELHHYKHRDNQWIGYTNALLLSGLKFVGWAAAFITGWILVVQITQQDLLSHAPSQIIERLSRLIPEADLEPVLRPLFPSDAEWEALRNKAATINMSMVAFSVLVNTLPLATFSGLLALFLWYNLMRFRELYADGGVVHYQRDITYLREAHLLIGSTVTFDTDSGTASRVGSGPGHLRTRIQEISALVAPLVAARLQLFKMWLDYHPLAEQRDRCLADPRFLYDGWLKSAVLIGAFVLGLDIMVTGTSALLFVGQWPLHLPVLLTFILVSLTVAIWLVLGRDVRRDSLKLIGLALVPRSIVILLIVAVLFIASAITPTELTRFLNASASAIAGYVGVVQPSDVGDIQAMVMEAAIKNVAQLVVMPVVLLLATWFYITIARRILTWYSFPCANNALMWVIYRLIMVMTIVLAFGILPLMTDLVLLRFTSLWAPSRWIGVVFALGMALIAYRWFLVHDRRYGRRCAHCGQPAPSRYTFGTVCPTCNQHLHSWLVVDYIVEHA